VKSQGKGKIRENLRAENRYTNELSRSWKISRLEKRNIRENSCLRSGTLTFSKEFCEISRLGKLQAL
jgi:hypothetical protein